MKRLFRYLNGTVSFGLLYSQDKKQECMGYNDADVGFIMGTPDAKQQDDIMKAPFGDN